MRCPHCHGEESKVLESRMSQEHNQIRRRRECLSCQRRFTTYERSEEHLSYVEKRSGKQEPYYADKALKSIHIACRKRPVSLKEMEHLLHRVEQDLLENNGSLVESSQLGEAIMGALKELDMVAYVRFASVYMDFNHPSEFSIVLDQLSDADARVGSKKNLWRQEHKGLPIS